MIKIKAKIKVYDESDDVVDASDVSTQTANPNYAEDIGGVVNSFLGARNIFLLKDADGNGTKLSENAKYSNPDGESFYIGKSWSSGEEDKESYELGGGYPFDNSVNIVFDNSTGAHPQLPNKISITFDEDNVGFATRIIVVQNNVEKQIINSSTTITIEIENQNLPLTVKIMAWNKPNRPVVITSIYANLYFDIDDSRMMNCEFELNEKADPSLPNFGVISNDGSIEFRDYDGKFLRLIEQGRLHEKKQVSFYLENTYDRTEQEISTFLSNDVSYDDDSRVANISLVDNLVAWQDVKDVRIYLQKNKTMKDVYDALVDLSAPLGYEFADIDNDNEFSDLKSYLMSITLGYFFLKNDNLWAQWQKFCEATGLYLYINKENKIVLGSEFNF